MEETPNRTDMEETPNGIATVGKPAVYGTGWWLTALSPNHVSTQHLRL